MMGAVAGLASREGVEVLGMEAAAVSYPGFVEDLDGWPLSVPAVGPRAPACRCGAGAGRRGRGDADRDRRPGGCRQVDGRARAGAQAGLHLPGQRRDVSLRGAAGARVRPVETPAALARERAHRAAAARAVLLDGVTSARRSARRGSPRRPRSRRRPGRARGAASPSSASCRHAATGSPRAATSARSSRPTPS